jgi:hypothetical protein
VALGYATCLTMCHILHERNRLLAHIVPQPAHAEPKEWPDFAGRIEKLFGERSLPGADLLIEERGRF